MSKRIQYASSTQNPLFHPLESSGMASSNGSADQIPSGSFLDFTEPECSVIFFGFLTSSIIGTACNLFLLLVLLVKMWCESMNKSASDQLVACLTTIDLIACSLLFPLECEHFSHPDCNIDQRRFDKFLTLFLELASTGALLNIAVCRYLMVCWATRVKVSFNISLVMSSANILISMAGAAAAILLQTTEITILIYLLGILSVMVLMALLYFLIFWKLYKRAEVARKRSKNAILSLQSGSQKTGVAATPSIPQIELTPVEHNEDQEHEELASSKKLNRNKETTFNRESLKEHTEDSLHYKKRRSVNFVANPLASLKQTKTSSEKKSHQVSQMELMMKRSAKIFVIITALYIFCFLPNAILTICYFIIGQTFITGAKPVIIEYIIKYVNLFYNINFILMPLVYAILNRQFREDCGKLKMKMFGGDSRVNGKGSRSPSSRSPRMRAVKSRADSGVTGNHLVAMHNPDQLSVVVSNVGNSNISKI